MKSILKLLFAILIASSSAFFILGENAEVVEAKTCPPGEFPHLKTDGSVACENPIDTTKEDTSQAAIGGIKTYVMTFLQVLIVVSSSISALVITYAGYLYITSEGNPKKTEEAKVMLFRAGVGILILSLSFVIMNMLSVSTGILW